MRRGRRIRGHLPNNDTEFYTCPHCSCPELTIPVRGTHDLQGRRLYQCSRCGQITSNTLLMRASAKRRLLD
jgi:uncharacterized Zn finger protein